MVSEGFDVVLDKDRVFFGGSAPGVEVFVEGVLAAVVGTVAAGGAEGFPGYLGTFGERLADGGAADGQEDEEEDCDGEYCLFHFGRHLGVVVYWMLVLRSVQKRPLTALRAFRHALHC